MVSPKTFRRPTNSLILYNKPNTRGNPFLPAPQGKRRKMPRREQRVATMCKVGFSAISTPCAPMHVAVENIGARHSCRSICMVRVHVAVESMGERHSCRSICMVRVHVAVESMGERHSCRSICMVRVHVTEESMGERHSCRSICVRCAPTTQTPAWRMERQECRSPMQAHHSGGWSGRNIVACRVLVAQRPFGRSRRGKAPRLLSLPTVTDERPEKSRMGRQWNGRSGAMPSPGRGGLFFVPRRGAVWITA